MADDTQNPTPQENNVTEVPELTSPIDTSGKESTIFGVSIRAILAILLVLTVCIMSFMKYEVKEPLYTLVMVISSFYFGHQMGKSK